MQQDKQLTESRKRKFLIMLPVLTVPFLFLLFYSLGGGKGQDTIEQSRSSALSTTLPDPLLDDKQPMDKLSLYQRAEKDSVDRQRAAAYDPFAAWMPGDSTKIFPHATDSASRYWAEHLQQQNSKGPEVELEQKIAALEKALQTPDTPVALTMPAELPQSDSSPELERLEAMMQSLSTGAAAPDPELAQAQNLMEKILDVQHPERVKERLRQQSNEDKKTVYAVSNTAEEESTDLLTSSPPITYPDSLLFPYRHVSATSSAIGFYDEDLETPFEQNALLATVHKSQSLVSGATIEIRLQQDAYVQGQLIPKGSSVFGICSLNGERLEVSINSIRYGNSIYPVSLIAYDMDGLPGIRIPGSINRDASKESSERAIQSLSLGSLDPSIGAQAAAAGIEAAKTLLSRKVKLIKVMVKDGYPLLLAPDRTNS